MKPVILAVQELLYQVKRACQEHVGWVAVRGEISGFQVARSGHLYFRLKDTQGTLDAIMFKQAREALRFVPEDGMEVIAWGEATLYAPQGRLQLSVELMERVGWGTVAYALSERKARLAEEGLFDADRKRLLPPTPRRIALVTSATGAALQDLLHVLRRRSPSCRLLLASCQVQGAGAAEEMAAVLGRLQIYHHTEILSGRAGIDLIILGRGGGTVEDLWPFQEEVLVRAVAGSLVPVLTGIGHETDTSLADLAADASAPTPSAAAEIAVPDTRQLLLRLASWRQRLVASVLQVQKQYRFRLHLLEQRLAPPGLTLQEARRDLQALRQRLYAAMRVLVKTARERCARAELRLRAKEPRAELAHGRQVLASLERALKLAMRRQTHDAAQHLALLAARLHALSPLQVLSRGYALAYDEEGDLLRNSKTLAPGMRVTLRLSEGQVMARVEVVWEEGGAKEL